MRDPDRIPAVGDRCLPCWIGFHEHCAVGRWCPCSHPDCLAPVGTADAADSPEDPHDAC